MAMDIKTGRMVYLGYGKYWRSDEIVGLNPIEEGRGPGRRTEVYTGSRPTPMIRQLGLIWGLSTLRRRNLN